MERSAPAGILKAVGDTIAIVALVVASFLPGSLFKTVLGGFALGYVGLDVLFTARTGYLRRRPHWTPGSWRRYLTACLIPVGALVILWGILIALALELPIVGAPLSSIRGFWALGALVFLLIGAGGLAFAVAWLATAEPSRQFPRFPWWRRAPPEPDHTA